MISQNIKELRLELALTQKQLAKEIGVSQGAIYFWEKGINEPTATYVYKLADFFGVSADELLGINIKKNEVSTKAQTMFSLFEELNDNQKDLAINILKEMVKQK